MLTMIKSFIHFLLGTLIKVFIGTGMGKLPYVMQIYKILLKFSRPEIANVQNKKMQLDKGDSLGLSILGVNDETLTSFIKKEIGKDKVLIDIGAHIGYFTLIFSELVGSKGTVIAFEPSKENFEILKKNITLNNYKNVHLENLAVSDSTGSVMFSLSKDSQTNKISDKNVKNGYSVKCVKLDDYLAAKKMKVDYVKIDVEGAERKVIDGMVKTLEMNKNIKLILEFCPKQLREFKSSPGELLALLEEGGFNFYDVSNRKKTVTRMSKNKLLKEYSKGSYVTNIFCTREKNLASDWHNKFHNNG